MDPASDSMRILICEDDDTLRNLVARALSGRARVEAAASAREALEIASQGTLDAIACDISLPDISGLELMPRLREMQPAAGIVVVTGHGDVSVAVNAMKAGADDFLPKPFDIEILWHMLNKASDTRRQRIEAAEAAAYRALAYTDALTDCPNRRFIDEFLVDAMASARDHGTPLIVAFIDVDNFKLINDYAGHEEGDRLLQRIAAALRDVVHEPSAFGRYGGDEFVAIFPGFDSHAAAQLLDRIRHVTSQMEIAAGASISLPARMSIGIAELNDTDSPRELIGRAEDAMYLDKTIAPALLADGMTRAVADMSSESIANLRVLRGLVLAIDRRDAYTRYHSDHATVLALRMASHLDLGPADRNAILLGGPIHDLGKIVVPDNILRKPGPLTADERRMMEMHPVTGAAITGSVIDADEVVNLVRHHHERFDGDGYPGRLRGADISLVTRIFTLSDAYSAMTTDRPYRKGMPFEQAAGIIRTCAGTQFDPDLAPVFIDIVARQASYPVPPLAIWPDIPLTGS